MSRNRYIIKFPIQYYRTVYLPNGTSREELVTINRKEFWARLRMTRRHKGRTIFDRTT